MRYLQILEMLRNEYGCAPIIQIDEGETLFSYLSNFYSRVELHSINHPRYESPYIVWETCEFLVKVWNYGIQVECHGNPRHAGFRICSTDGFTTVGRAISETTTQKYHIREWIKGVHDSATSRVVKYAYKLIIKEEK